MSIWRKKVTTEDLNRLCDGTLNSHLGMCITEIGDDFLRCTMPVDERTRQPMGILHGGASVALAESVGSIASHMIIGPESRCVGLEINANHLRSVSGGLITATARPVHLGGLTHVWDIRITDPQERLVCIARLTMAIIACAAAADPLADAAQERAAGGPHPLCRPAMPVGPGNRPPAPTGR